MAVIKLVRADFRLIHGQVVTKWIRQSGVNRILIIDDLLYGDDFMMNIYRMSAPTGFPVEVLSKDEAVKQWKDSRLGSGAIFLLIRDVKTIYQCVEEGLCIDELQIGGLGDAPGRVKVYGPITLNDEDASMLARLQAKGVKVVFHQVPEEPSVTFDKIQGKFSFKLESL